MINISKEKEYMPTEKPENRVNNFDEVESGYDSNSALKEAQRCLNCKAKPCVKGCPVSVDIPEFIGKICRNDVRAAFEIISKSNPFPAVCGRVCPQEKQCEAFCVKGKIGEPVGIGRLERYVGDCASAHNFKIQSDLKKDDGFSYSDFKVAVIGSGPSGLSCAHELNKIGFKVTIFETLHEFGGVLSYGIPKFRLPKSVTNYEINKLKEYGIEMINNIVVGKSITIDDLFSMSYSAVYIASGAGFPKFMNIKGENLQGIYSANEFLTRINLMNAHKDEYDTPLTELGEVIVIGGGNVAIDAARCARRLTKNDVTVIYRRSETEMPARLDEIAHAKEENIKFMFLSNPTEFLGSEGKLREIKYQKMKFTEPDESGRRGVQPDSDKYYIMKADTAIVAIGNNSNPIISESTPNLECDKFGRILIKSGQTRTSIPFVYAGGDIVTGAATVISAMSAGKKAAHEICEDLKNKN